MTTTPNSSPASGSNSGDGAHNAVPSTGPSEPAPTFMAEWRRFGAFLRRPTLDVGNQSGRALTVLGRIYTLDMALMFVLIGIASALAAAGVKIPETALAGVEFTPLIVFAVIIGAPVMEEIVFRSWLGERPGPILAMLLLVTGLGAAFLLHPTSAPAGIALGAIGVIGAALALFLLRKVRSTAQLTKMFPVFFWLSTIAFALVHLPNFEGFSIAMLPLVLPQLILGTMLAYVRVRFALWAAIALHAAHNATALSIAALAGQLP